MGEYVPDKSRIASLCIPRQELQRMSLCHNHNDKEGLRHSLKCRIAGSNIRWTDTPLDALCLI